MNCSDAMFYPWWCGSRCYYYCKQRHNCHWRYFCYQQLLDDLSIPYFSSELHLFTLCILLKKIFNWSTLPNPLPELERSFDELGKLGSRFLLPEPRGRNSYFSWYNYPQQNLFCSSHFDHFTKIEVLHLYHIIYNFTILQFHIVLLAPLLIIVVEDLQIWILPPERGIGGAVGKLRPNINFCVPE